MCAGKKIWRVKEGENGGGEEGERMKNGNYLITDTALDLNITCHGNCYHAVIFITLYIETEDNHHTSIVLLTIVYMQRRKITRIRHILTSK